jgi:hypothetical protein
MLSEQLKPSQRRAYIEVLDLCRRAKVHLDRLRIAGVPMEQEEERVQHLILGAEGVLAHDSSLGQKADG